MPGTHYSPQKGAPVTTLLLLGLLAAWMAIFLPIAFLMFLPPDTGTAQHLRAHPRGHRDAHAATLAPGGHEPRPIPGRHKPGAIERDRAA